jgi:hypothetical protein
MSITTYATMDELRPLIGVKASETTDEGRLQRVLNTAARLFDEATRGPYVVEGAEAYSATTATRTFTDNIYDSFIDIPDLLSVTTITRGSTEVTTGNYKLLPLNPGLGPYTQIQFGSGLAIERDTEDHWYFHNLGYISGGISIAGSWGYCTAANRPDAVEEAVLNWAAVIYKTGALTMQDLLQMISTQNPNKILAANVVGIVEAFKRKSREICV